MNGTYNCAQLSGFAHDYCLLDRFEACALYAACPSTIGSSALASKQQGECKPASQLKLIKLAKCIEFEHDTDPKYNGPCAKAAGFDADALEKCAAAVPGESMPAAPPIMSYVWTVAKTSSPPVRGFPDIRLNGKGMWPGGVPSTSSELKRAICAAYTGPKPQPVCGASG